MQEVGRSLENRNKRYGDECPINETIIEKRERSMNFEGYILQTLPPKGPKILDTKLNSETLVFVSRDHERVGLQVQR